MMAHALASTTLTDFPSVSGHFTPTSSKSCCDNTEAVGRPAAWSFSMHQLPLQKAECVIHHCVPLGHVQAAGSFFASCGGSRRWTALRIVGFAKLFNVLCFNDLAERMLAAYTPPRSSRLLPPLVLHCIGLGWS